MTCISTVGSACPTQHVAVLSPRLYYPYARNTQVAAVHGCLKLRQLGVVNPPARQLRRVISVIQTEQQLHFLSSREFITCKAIVR